MSSDDNHLRQVRTLFDLAMEQPDVERAQFVRQATEFSDSVRDDVEGLLSSTDDADDLLEPHLLSAQDGPAIGSNRIGQRLGPYFVVRLIGTGGMGDVYEGVRADDQYRKRVAIKLVQSGRDSEATLTHFRRERQILASLEHPHIATLLDGGAAPDGRPFLVMEYVEGSPITTWCNERALPVDERLALFRQVCEAVQYAHKNLVVHRDLKPGNILVTADGSVKLLDFGIAKLLRTDDDSPDAPATRGEARSYTPEYASPEQIQGGLLTTASDVYSLGVILFELLAGRRPYVTATRAALDIERAVTHDPVPRPSTVITDSAAPALGERSPERLRRKLSGELDNITLRALHKEPARRYASVEALSEDIRRHLTGLPVLAQRDWAGYRLRKFAQRNIGVVSASLLLLLALIGGVIATTVQAHRARTAQLKSDQVNAFLRSLLSSVQPDVGHRDVQVSEVLDSAALRLERELKDQPEVRGDLEAVIGQSYAALGRFDQGEQHLRAAVELRSRTAGPADSSVVAVMSDLGQLYMAKGALDSARTVFQRALDLYQSHARTPDSRYSSLLLNMASLAHNQGHAPEAERLHRQVLAIRRRVLGEHDDLTALAINNVAVAIGEQGRLAEAESLSRVALGILRANHPEPSVVVSGALNALAGVLDFQGKIAPAESAYVATLAIRKQLLGDDHPEYLSTLYNYSMFIFDQKRYQEAADDARHILSLRGKSLPESHPSVAASLQTLGRSLDVLGDHQGAEKALQESLALRLKYLGEDAWPVASSEGMLGDHYLLMKEYPDAERILLSAQARFIRLLGETHSRTLVNSRRLVALYTAWGKPAKAEVYSALLAKATPTAK